MQITSRLRTHNQNSTVAANAKLKKLLAEQMLDLAAMKELVSKKW